MTLKTLENTTLTDLVDCFNASFKNYFVKVNLTPELLSEKLKADATDLNYSVGAFDNNKLVAFILHGIDTLEGEKVAYNGGTGVIEEFRGKNITLRLYDYILPRLKSAGINKSVLEVIEENIPAIKQYKKAGFKKKRKLACFSGKLTDIQKNSNLLIKEITKADWKIFQEFWSWKPTWQHSIATIKRLPEKFKIIGTGNEDQIIAYGVVNPESGRVMQFAVKLEFRRKKYATLLFNHMRLISKKPISVINVDEKDDGSIQFLKKLGLQDKMGQIEMEMDF